MLVLFAESSAAIAGTTGSLSGTVTNPDTRTPVAAARVTVSSPSQTVSTLTDNGGHFTFASLAPDSYTVSVEKQGFQSVSQPGVNVLADQDQVVNLSEAAALRKIGQVTARSRSDLVSPGTTADVYSVNAVQQDKFSGVGGGGGLNNAYSAIATVPGAYVPANQAGYFQTIHIRGGDYDQVGYEVDGVPVNRSFDNYPSGTASSLGQQELQVYTGAAPPNAEGQGLSGFINQVIRSGTYPGFAQGVLSIGGPSFYHKASIEFGGATSNRNFSYYVGLGGYGQDFRYVDQGNGQGLRPYGAIVGSPSTTPTTLDGNPFGPIVTTAFESGNPQSVIDRDTVINLHLGIPHKNGIKDDVQLLYLNNFLQTYFFSSPNDTGLNSFVAANGSVPSFADAYQYTGAVGAFLPNNAAKLVQPSLFPSSPRDRTFGATIPVDLRDSWRNNQSIIKLQYQKNFSSNAYFRLYGYTDYSNWLQNGPNFANNTFLNTGFPVGSEVSGDYELSAHGRGLSGTIADQINQQNLLQVQGSYTTATTLRDNNVQFENSAGRRGNFAELVDSNNPLSGICYNAGAAIGNVAAATDCNTYVGTPAATSLSLSQVYASTQPGGKPVQLDYSNFTCGTGPCRFFAVENGQFATYNTVKPSFIAGSLTDTYKPTDRLVINLGLRYDLYQFQGSDTTATPARTLFFNSFNRTNCVDPTGNIVTKTSLGIGLTAGCATANAGTATYTTPNLQNASSQVNTYPVFEPRIGATFTVNPSTVLRASYGRYSQAPNTAFEQYNYLQQNSPSQLGTAFYKFGFTTPSHLITPEVSNNYDVSLEHRFSNTDLAIKLTPFYRYTQNQIQNFFLDQASGFVSGLNADRLTSRGVEFQINKGDFVRDGFSGQLAFTYTNAFAQYNTFSNGTTVFTGINNDIQKYNGYTSFCGTHPNDARCPAGGSPNASPCFTLATAGTGGGAAACAAGTVANPYYNAPVQSLVDTNGKYAPFTLIAGGIGSAAESYLTPYVATMVLQYKKGKFAATPSFQFSGGQRYGVPEANAGIDPTSCTGTLAGTTAGDPRYPYGAAGGAPFDASACATLGSAIPDTYTKRFDGIGDFVAPSNFVTNMQLSYDATKNFTLVATFANIINNCFGGSKVPWNNGGSQVCSYGLVDNGNAYVPVGNAYNPGANVAPALQYPYERSYGVFNTNSISVKYPFSVYVDARFKV